MPLLARLSDQITTPSPQINFYFMSRFGASAVAAVMGTEAAASGLLRLSVRLYRSIPGRLVPAALSPLWSPVRQRSCLSAGRPTGRWSLLPALRPRPHEPAAPAGGQAGAAAARWGRILGTEHHRANFLVSDRRRPGPDPAVSFPAGRDRTQSRDATVVTDITMAGTTGHRWWTRLTLTINYVKLIHQ